MMFNTLTTAIMIPANRIQSAPSAVGRGPGADAVPASPAPPSCLPASTVDISDLPWLLVAGARVDAGARTTGQAWTPGAAATIACARLSPRVHPPHPPRRRGPTGHAN